MSIVIDKDKFTALVPLISGLPGFSQQSIQNTYTLKFSFESGFACLVSRNTKNSNLSVHFEKEDKDAANHFIILSAIN